MPILLTLLEAFSVGIMHRREGASMSAHPGIPDAGPLPSAYWAGYMMTDWFEFDARAVNAQGYTFDEIQRNLDALGIDWTSHLIHGSDDGCKEAEVFGVMAVFDDCRDFHAMVACGKATSWLSPAHRVRAELQYSMDVIDAAHAIIDDCQRVEREHDERWAAL
jgi:hypothetical protein